MERKFSACQLKELNEAADPDQLFDDILHVSEHKNVTILLCKSSFALFFPKELWHSFDIEVNDYLHLPVKECWLFTKGAAMHKMNFHRDKVDRNDKTVEAFVADDLDARQKRVVQYLEKSFLSNPQVYPESEYFTIGAALKGVPRPFRIRLGGKFRLNFS